MSHDAPADRSWAVPVIGLLVVTMGVPVLGGGLFLLGSTGTCACSPPPPSHTPTFGEVQAQANVDQVGNGTVSISFADNRNAAALLVVVAPADGQGTTKPTETSTPTATSTPAATGTPTTSGTAGSPAPTDAATATRTATATAAPTGATFLDGSVTVVEASSGTVGVTDRGLRLREEGAVVRLSLDTAVTIRVVALPPADSDLDRQVVETWSGTA